MSNGTMIGAIAPIRNVVLAAETLASIVTRPPGAPGLACLYGPSGYGKSVATAAAAVHQNAIYVRAMSFWTRRSLIDSLLFELSVPAFKGTIHAGVRLIADRIAGPRPRPIIIDEADHIARGQLVELVRDLADITDAPILLIGEEGLPLALNRWERVHNRVLVWAPVQPCDADDLALLAAHYCRGLALADPLLADLLRACKGRARRLSVNLARVTEEARRRGWQSVDLAAWGDRGWYVGDAPEPRGRS